MKARQPWVAGLVLLPVESVQLLLGRGLGGGCRAFGAPSRSCACGACGGFGLRCLLGGDLLAVGDLYEAENGVFALAPLFIVLEGGDALRAPQNVPVAFQGAFAFQTTIEGHGKSPRLDQNQNR